MTVPDLPVEGLQPVRLLFDHQFGSAGGGIRFLTRPALL